MKADLKQKWLAALRSGDYQQGQGELLDVSDNAFCCLGVLCSVAGIERKDISLWATIEGLGRADLVGYEYTDTLMEMNDDEGKSFAEIADWIEANIPADAA